MAFGDRFKSVASGIFKFGERPILFEGEGHNFLPTIFGVDENYQGKYIGNGKNYFVNGKVPGLGETEKNSRLADAIFEVAIKDMMPQMKDEDAYIVDKMVKSFLKGTLFYSKEFEKTKDGKIPFVLNVRDDALLGQIATIESGHKEIAITANDGCLSISAENNEINSVIGFVGNGFAMMINEENGGDHYFSELSIYPKQSGGFVAAQYEVKLERLTYENCIFDALQFVGQAGMVSVSEDGRVSKIPVGQYDKTFQIALENGVPFVDKSALDEKGKEEYERRFEEAKEEGQTYSYDWIVGLACDIALSRSELSNKCDQFFEDAERFAKTGVLTHEEDATNSLDDENAQ